MISSKELSKLLRIWAYGIVLLVSYIVGRPIAGHSLSVKRISIRSLSLHGVNYSGTLYGGTYPYTFTCSKISICFHIPFPSNPHWCTFTADSLVYVSTTCNVSVEQLVSVLWLFPVLFGRTSGPWADVTLDGFRIRVDRSRETPYYIQQLRENIVRTILCGEILKVDNFKSDINMTGLSEIGQTYADDNSDGSRHQLESQRSNDTSMLAGPDLGVKPLGQRKQKQLLGIHDKDAIRVSALARHLHVHNMRGRLYTFGEVNAQVRRNWDTDQGSLVIVAEQSSWQKFQWPPTNYRPSAWSQLITTISQFPFELIHLLKSPIHLVDLYVPRADITYDEFRLRDAELVIQAIATLREKLLNSDIDWISLLLDAAAQILAPE